MEYYQKTSCPKYRHTDLNKAGKSTHGVQRYCCLNSECITHTFMLEYRYKGCEPNIKKKILDMTLNASGIRDIKLVLKIVVEF